MVVGTIREEGVPLLVDQEDRQGKDMTVGDLLRGMVGGDRALPLGGGAILLQGAHGHLHHGVEVHQEKEGDLQVILRAQVDLTPRILSVEVEAGVPADQEAIARGAGVDHAAEDEALSGDDIHLYCSRTKP